MNFSYEKNDSNVLEGYIKEGNNYTLYYLNGTKTSFYISDDEYYKKLNNILIEQSIKREESARKDLNINKTIDYISIISSQIAFIISIKLKMPLIYYASILLFPIFLIDLISNQKKVRELNKYKAYISIKDELTKDKYKKIRTIINYDGEEEIDINNLDNVKYSDVKKLVRTVKKEIKKEKKSNN